MVLHIFPPHFFPARIPPIPCVTRATWQTVMVWCAIKMVVRCISGWGFRTYLVLVSGVAPTLKALKLFKRGLWNLVQDTNREVCLFRSTGMHYCGQPRHGRFPYVIGALLYFLRVIEIFMTNWAHVYGDFFDCVCCQPTSGRIDYGKGPYWASGRPSDNFSWLKAAFELLHQ